MKKNTLNGQLTKEAIEQLKAKHGDVYQITAADHVAYFRKPKREDINYAASMLDPQNPLTYFENIMSDCFLDGSRAILEDDTFFMGAMASFKPIVEGEKATLAKL